MITAGSDGENTSSLPAISRLWVVFQYTSLWPSRSGRS
jgi:hypothetical protein